MKPLPGDIGLVPLPGVAGRVIRIGQWLNGDGYANYEHACIAMGNNFCVGAHPGGARVDVVAEGTLWFDFGLSSSERDEITCAAYGYIGTPYSFLDYQALAAHHFHLPMPGLRDYISNTEHMICSQLVDQCYADADVHLFDDHRWPGYVTPGALYELLV